MSLGVAAGRAEKQGRRVVTDDQADAPGQVARSDKGRAWEGGGRRIAAAAAAAAGEVSALGRVDLRCAAHYCRGLDCQWGADERAREGRPIELKWRVEQPTKRRAVSNPAEARPGQQQVTGCHWPETPVVMSSDQAGLSEASDRWQFRAAPSASGPRANNESRLMAI